MWLKKIEVKNFKSIEDISIDFTPGVNIIFGENGAGKTNIIKAILKILGPSFPSSNSFLKEDYFCFDESKRLKIFFEFIDKEKLITLSWDKNFGSQKFDLLVNEKNHISSDMRLELCPLHIPPNRTIKDVPGISRSTPLGRIIFELAKMIEKNKALYLDYQSKMSECVKILEKSDEFSHFKHDVEKYSSEQIGQRGERINIKLDLLDHKHILKTLQIFEMIGDEQCNLSDGGQGIQSNVTIAAIRAFSSIYHGGYYIVADEPEAYLHPLAQRALCGIFEEIAGNGTQVIITTHSPHFVSQNHLEGLIRVWMDNNRTKCKKIDLDSLLQKKTERIKSCGTSEGLNARLDRMLSVQVKEGLFANTIVLCEGESEALSLEIWGEILDFNFHKSGIAVVPSNGKNSMIDLAEFYQNLNIPVFLIFDSDSDCKETEKQNHATHNKFLLNFAGAPIHDFPETKVFDACCVFSPNFDVVLETIDEKYKPKVLEVNKELGLKTESNKGIRAKYVAMKYQEGGITPPQIIRDLLESISVFQRANT